MLNISVNRHHRPRTTDKTIRDIFTFVALTIEMTSSRSSKVNFCRLMADKPMSRYCRRGVVCLSVRPSVTIVDCGQTAIDRGMVSSLSDRANIWLRNALNSIEIGLAVFEQWRLQWGYPPFRVDGDMLIGHIFGSTARGKHRTAKIMAPYYRQLFTANPMAQIPLSVDDREGFK